MSAVHEKGGIFFCQLWHAGRASDYCNFPFPFVLLVVFIMVKIFSPIWTKNVFIENYSVFLDFFFWKIWLMFLYLISYLQMNLENIFCCLIHRENY